MNIIKSVNSSQQQIINDILNLHNGGEDIDLDCTYSKGVFYKNGLVQEPKYKSDLIPQVEGVILANSESLPFNDNSMKCIMYDPPFVISGKAYKESKEGSSIISKRFGAYTNFEDLKSNYCKTLRELHRVLKQNGILIMKCQNTVSSGKQHFTHFFILKEAIKIGYYPKDEFVLISKSKMTSFGARWKTQKHAMKYHSYFLVLQKKSCRVNYEYDDAEINNN